MAAINMLLYRMVMEERGTSAGRRPRGRDELARVRELCARLTHPAFGLHSTHPRPPMIQSYAAIAKVLFFDIDGLHLNARQEN